MVKESFELLNLIGTIFSQTSFSSPDQFGDRENMFLAQGGLKL